MDWPEFQLGIFDLQIKFLEDAFFPAWKLGSILRGAFGLAVRRLVCPDLSWPCQGCRLYQGCAYGRVFEPSFEGVKRLSVPPRPYVFGIPENAAERWGANQLMGFNLCLFGTALEYLPYFLLALNSLGAEGLGPGRAAFQVFSVRHWGEELYDPGRGIIQQPKRYLGPADLQARVDQLNARTLRLKFLTPTCLVHDNTICRQAPSFEALFKRCRDRVSGLHSAFGQGIEADYSGLARRAQHVKLKESNSRWQRVWRSSTRTGQEHPLEGLIGESVYEGDLEEFLPWLAMAEWLHVGKHATFGLGRVAFEKF